MALNIFRVNSSRVCIEKGDKKMRQVIIKDCEGRVYSTWDATDKQIKAINQILTGSA